MKLDDLHLISLSNVLKKMNIYLSEDKKRELVYFWHKLNPWKDTTKGLISLKKKFITSSLSNGNIELQKNLVKYANLKFNFIMLLKHQINLIIIHLHFQKFYYI